MTDDHAIDWQAKADGLSAYLRSRGLALHEGIMLLAWALAVSARQLSDSDEETRAAIAHFAGQMEKLAGLPPATRQ